MTNKQPKPYNAIPNYFERTPQELTAPGEIMAHSERITELGRMLVGSIISDLCIEPNDLERYRSVGPAVGVPNHRSMVDLSALSTLGELSGEGQPYFLSKRENMNNPLTARVLGKMRTFPMDRDMSDPRWVTVFSRWSKFVLTEEKKKLIIFGEGSRKSGPTVHEMFSGPLLAARRNKVPVLPIGIAGTDEISVRRGRISVVITVGEPYMVTDMKDNEGLREKVQEQYDRANDLILFNA